MTPLARVDRLTVTAPDTTRILDQVSLELAPGRVTGLVGESGAGKTTLAQAFLGHLGPGLHRADGTVEVAGLDPFARAGRRALRGRLVAYVPQDPASALDPRRPLLAQLRTAARIAHPGEDRRARAARIAGAVRAAAIEERLLRRHPAHLSGGQAQRMLLAWAFLARPRLIILDEPTSGLDPDTADRVSSAFAALPWQPAVLLISHDHALVARTAHATFELAAGRLRPTPTPAATPQIAPASTPAPGPASAASGPALSVAELTIRHGDQRVLDHACLTVRPGELLAVRGPSGSGKTSLARALCGLAPPDAGLLHVHGVLVGWDAAARARTGGPFLAYVGQDARAALNPHEPARRTLGRALAAARRRGRAPVWGTEELLERFALDSALLDRTPDRLSGGQRHRLALARAVAAAPAVLVCDESTASLDAATQAHVLDSLDALRHRDGTPVLLITHADQVAARADRTLTLREGRLR